MVEPERTQTIWRMRVAYSISKPKRAQAHTSANAPTPTHLPTHVDARIHTHALYNVNAPKYYVIRTLPVLLAYINYSVVF